MIRYIGSSVLNDNELALFEELKTVVLHADPVPDITIDRKPEVITVHIKPSNSEFKEKIISNILHINRQKKSYRIRFSSSLKISRTISFTISTDKFAILST